MAKKRKRKQIPRRERLRRARIREGLKRYHKDVRKVQKATKTTWRVAQSLIPPAVRRIRKGRGRGALLRGGNLLDVARERHAVTRESEYIPPAETAEAPESIEGKSVEITYVDLLEYLIEASRRGDSVEIAVPFYELPQEKMEPGPRASEISRGFGAEGDRAHAEDKNRYWRIRESFTMTFGKNGWVLL